MASAIKPERRLWLAVILFFSTAIYAEVTGLSDKLLNYVSETYGAEARVRLLDWQDLMRSKSGVSEADKLRVVNLFFNKLRFVDDIQHWKKADYWATPVETLATNGGDCEDFSIAKYFTLREMGVPDDRMLITYVKSIGLNQAHMVLTYYASPDADPLVLDNLTDEIMPASARKDLVPVYSFNGSDLWLSKERGRGKRVGSSDQISLWRDLAARIEVERAK